MDADAHISPVAALLADSSRSAILWALSDGRALPACELALAAGVRPSTISHHLAKLVAGGLLTRESQGRHRYFRLADPTVVGLLEALAAFAPAAPARTYREGRLAKSVRAARTCYDHLAGKLGVEITEALARLGCLKESDRDYLLTAEGERLLGGIGVDLEGARAARRSFARACLDWSERRFHLAGALGAALLRRLFELDWVRRVETGRAVRVSEAGRDGLRELLGMEL